ncbi:hypothetical protein M406DRAFT_284375 [Cryphonectria parasitica EP155]|uniref:Tafazzin family protein n=1 Tax=Cryphonectria parasitica (strain ATCC 38755 / EP155) TaxID=660469 RepID=A0A9P4YBA5_CRYP1|nr:uncharacterized protein M406DRAFT_284375 [Cryphonectria parasitica EP155]KAF3769898.1 hypothetical protein M406DRAFT_284375 [Cryphonectria parasitica EP155]
MTTIAHGQYPQRRPNGLWRGTSAMIMGLTTTLSKGFLSGLNNLEVIGLDNFVELLESRSDPYERQRGLITVSNHVSVMDDPLIWGVLPLRLAFQPWTLRWGLGAHDICFKNRAFATFFTLGQVVPIHRSWHSTHAGLFQPSMTQAIRLLSAYPFKTLKEHQAVAPPQPKTVTVQSLLADLRDPFTEGGLTYSTTGHDVHTAPSAFLSNRHAWVHVFPEGLVHQHPERQMRYFKWGVSRLILEAEPMPDVVPMFIDGTCEVMHEDRGWPRFIPRAGKDVRVAFGDKLDMEHTFGDLRRRWKGLVKKEAEKRDADIRAAEDEIERATRLKAPDVLRIGELTDELKYNKEAQEIRIEVARRVRDEVVKLRRSLGYPDEDPSFGLAETWAKDPKNTKKSPVDGSIEKPST